MDLEKIVSTYTKIRDKRGAIKKAYEAEDNDLKAKLEMLEGVLLRHLNDQKATSVNTPAGTFYRQRDVIPSCNDWGAFHRWVKETDSFDALERRIKKTFVTDLIEEQVAKAEADGNQQPEIALPPGVSTHERYVVRVRKN